MPESIVGWLDGLSVEERQLLIDEYAADEALHREALAQGMDADDLVIRNRLIEKARFLAQTLAESEIELDEKALQAFFEANKADYYMEPRVTFSHVYFDAEKRGVEAAQTAAATTLKQLNAEAAALSAAPKYGDRFSYRANFVARTQDFVASHFGQPIAQTIFSLSGDGRWHGPYRSPHGAHLVSVVKVEPGRTPPLEEIRARVEQEARKTQFTPLLT